MTAAADDPMSSATDLAEHLVEGGTPFREAHTVVGGLVRQAVERGRPARRARVERSAARSRLPRPARAGQRGAPADDAGRRRSRSRSRASSTRPASACTSSGSGSRGDGGPCRRARPDAAANVLRPRRARARAGAAQQAPRAYRRRTAARGADRRGRGVPRRRRSRQSCLPPPDAAQRDDVRAARASLRLLLLRQSLVHERGARARSATARGAAARGGAARRRRHDARAPRRRPPRSASCARARAGSARRSAWTAPTTASISYAARSASSTTASRRRPSPASRVRIGLAAGKGEERLYRFYVEGDENVSAKPR